MFYTQSGSNTFRAFLFTLICAIISAILQARLESLSTHARRAILPRGAVIATAGRNCSNCARMNRIEVRGVPPLSSDSRTKEMHGHGGDSQVTFNSDNRDSISFAPPPDAPLE